MLVISADQVYNLVTSAHFLDTIIKVTGVATVVLSFLSNLCSFVANFIPEPKEEEISKKLATVSKIVNFIAINTKKLKETKK